MEDDAELNKLLVESKKILDLIKILERKRRTTQQKNASEREKAVLLEYGQRVADGEDLTPLVEAVDLESLVGSDVFENVTDIDESLSINRVNVRKYNLSFYTPNLRALWQSFGQEFIEPELLNFIDDIPNEGIYFDLGASTGIFSIYAAAKGNTTYCFEPEATNFNILNRNAYLNKAMIAGNFNAFNIAVSNKLSLDTMFMKKFEASAHDKILGQSMARDGKEVFQADYEQRVLAISLDEFCALENIWPTDIKIDIDGAELDAIEGMTNTLKSSSLKRIFFEISEVEESSLKALEIVKGFGFNVQSKKRVQNYFTDYNYTLVRP